MDEKALVRPLTLDPSQELAVQLMVTATIGVVTGGPGTGKTTTLRAALDRLDALPEPTYAEQLGRATWDDGTPIDDDAQPDVTPWARYLLAAPTGKAARRMSEATGREAVTVHRLLDYGPRVGQAPGFRRDASNPIPASLVVVDESSMLDVELADALLAAIAPGVTRLILVGDANQLPSVGPGRVFADVIESGVVPVARLTTLHRAAQESWVCSSAPRVLAGEKPSLDNRHDFRWIAAPGPSDIRAAVLALAKKHVDAGEDVQVLAPQRTGPAGTEALNLAMQEAFNPRRAGEPAFKARGEGRAQLRIRDRVIQTSNDYTRGVMNGEVGEVVAIDAKSLTVDFEGRAVVYDAMSVGALDLAYALTIHKSQGSEWPHVIVLCHSTHTFMLDRHLLYTAITRAKKGVVLIGDDAGLATALKKVDSAKRNTRVGEVLRAAAGKEAA